MLVIGLFWSFFEAESEFHAPPAATVCDMFSFPGVNRIIEIRRSDELILAVFESDTPQREAHLVFLRL